MIGNCFLIKLAVSVMVEKLPGMKSLLVSLFFQRGSKTGKDFRETVKSASCAAMLSGTAAMRDETSLREWTSCNRPRIWFATSPPDFHHRARNVSRAVGLVEIINYQRLAF